MGVPEHGPCHPQRQSGGGKDLLNVRSALLWLTHAWCPDLEAEFEKLRSRQGPDLPEVWLGLDSRTPGASALAARYPRCHVYDEDTLFRLPYPRLDGHGLINHHHFPVLDFFLTHPDYDRYWVVEYDVRYTGTWEEFLRSLQGFDQDLITSHLRRHAQEPRWGWWDSLHHPVKVIGRSDYVRSFNVIYRVSNRALQFLHQAQMDGWRGYPEVSMPTLLLHGGFTLMDFGGDGEFTPPGHRNRVYTSRATRYGSLSPFCTMRYRPARIRAGRLKDKVYHPVKPRDMIETPMTRVRLARRWAWEFAVDHLSRYPEGAWARRKLTTVDRSLGPEKQT